jgi:outer membrane protein OmpA-like peptidoglycan-associated protein
MSLHGQSASEFQRCATPVARIHTPGATALLRTPLGLCYWLSMMARKPNSASEHAAINPRNRSRIPIVVAISLLLLLIAAGGFLLLNRTSDLQETVHQLEGRLDRAAETIEETARAAEEALQRAAEAEEYSRLAAEGRARAETLQSVAEAAASRAREESDHARQLVLVAQEEAKRLRAERALEMDRLQTALSRIAETRRTALGVVMNLDSSAIQFEFDRATIRQENRELLSRVAGILLTSSDYRVQIFGHTDDVGTEQYNQVLSERRAGAVRDYLITAGIDPEIITSKGFGKSSPLVQETSVLTRARNRRVELAVIDSTIDYSGYPPASTEPSR